ncbi:hypothetical protein U8Y08_22710, partial [Klebsiella pneumoniae]|uniref:hypothetical protein n=1 Tax=Klebsiella africana TaxID=2489010 RepID=UPI00265968A0
MAYFITTLCPARMPKSSQYMSHVNIVKISRGICRKDGEKGRDSAIQHAREITLVRGVLLVAIISCKKRERSEFCVMLKILQRHHF